MDAHLILHSAEEHAIHHAILGRRSYITCSVFLLKEARVCFALDGIALRQSVFFGIRQFNFGPIPLSSSEHHRVQALLHLPLEETDRLDGLLPLVLLSLVLSNLLAFFTVLPSLLELYLHNDWIKLILGTHDQVEKRNEHGETATNHAIE